MAALSSQLSYKSSLRVTFVVQPFSSRQQLSRQLATEYFHTPKFYHGCYVGFIYRYFCLVVLDRLVNFMVVYLESIEFVYLKWIQSVQCGWNRMVRFWSKVGHYKVSFLFAFWCQFNSLFGQIRHHCVVLKLWISVWVFSSGLDLTHRAGDGVLWGIGVN